MKAIVLRQFGGPEALSYEDIPGPEPAPGDVLISMRSSKRTGRWRRTRRAGKSCLPLERRQWRKIPSRADWATGLPVS